MDAETLMTLKEAADGLDAKYRLVRALLDAHAVPHRRVGRQILIDASGLAQLRSAIASWQSRLRPYGQKARATAGR